MKKLALLLSFSLAFLPMAAQKIWTAQQANAWYAKQPWIVGCNFIPSTAINELEMWQAETFDIKTINNELGLAQSLGFNTVRVYLHNLLWENDRTGLLSRMNEFLKTANQRSIKVIFVLFDDCWLPNPRIGKQPEPVPGVHNSGWLRAPGPEVVSHSEKWDLLELYAKDILLQFKDDKRILMWDLYNEPGNSEMTDMTFPLLERVFLWAQSIRPSQPLTCATWAHEEKFKRYYDFQLNNSDIITFHNYNDAKNLEEEIVRLEKLGRPVICSEYMARTNNSTFKKNLPVLKKHKVGAINWGLVSGKTNTIFPWGSKAGSPEPEVWFHDIFRKNGTPFDQTEVEFIKELTKKAPEK